KGNARYHLSLPTKARMNTPAPYLHWYFVLISVPNLVLIIVMLALFALALVAPFPSHGKHDK
ncbi:MAG: hypothetical protein ABI305_12075, partial [Tepidiformaceae bacterium]